MLAQMASRARKVAILADSTKLDRRLFATIGALEIADYLITSTAPTGALGKALAESSVEVLVPDATHHDRHQDKHRVKEDS